MVGDGLFVTRENVPSTVSVARMCAFDRLLIKSGCNPNMTSILSHLSLLNDFKTYRKMLSYVYPSPCLSFVAHSNSVIAARYI